MGLVQSKASARLPELASGSDYKLCIVWDVLAIIMGLCELLSRLLVSRLTTAIIVSYITPLKALWDYVGEDALG